MSNLVADGRNLIVMIDDQPDRIEYFAEALGSEGFAVKIIADVGEAVSYFSEPRPEVLAAVVDIIMPAGPFQNDDHQNGKHTGVLLYARICELQAVLRAAGKPLPLAVLTQIAEKETHDLLEKLQQKHHPLEKYQHWPKVGLEAREFAKQFKDWITGLEELYGPLR